MPLPVDAQPIDKRSGVVQRAFALLSAYDESHVALPLRTLARRSGLPANTTLRLARTLVELGALEHDAEGRYVIGVGLFEIAALAPRGHGLRRLAMPFMEDLGRVTGHHILLKIREGAEAVLIERLSPHGSEPLSFRIGGRLPLDSTGGGLILLAYAPNDIQEEVCRSFTPLPGYEAVQSGDDLRRSLAAIRQDGFVAARRSSPWFCAAVAAPIRDDSGAVIAALSVELRTDRLDNAEANALVPAVVTTARAISRRVSPGLL
ncbi:transcriptional regulator [Subtercola lobariae]|uniref:Transcriptional regulator n=2 Tax=Subtercola lobariae TaxID=1588641 RepID=A0A917F071_9MICO|nr:transcriptional regulator [Subtercola lobariae]